jgi:hypothetical protein
MSALLGQQQLLEPDPQRRLIVPAGHSAWWGVDGSTLRIALAGVSRRSDGVLDRWVKMRPFNPLEGAARLSEIYSATRGFVASVATCCTWPGVVMVEQPSGSKQSVNLPLIYAIGVMTTAIYDALVDVTGRAPRMASCTASWWKKRACGRGDLYKPKRGSGDQYGVLVWARQNGYMGDSFDEADALGIAEAARREVALVER